MNTELIQEWVDALRSGDYKQTSGVLGRERDGERSYCCLGVLCQVAVGHDIIAEPDVHGRELQYANFASTMPPPEVRQALAEGGEDRFYWEVNTPEELLQEEDSYSDVIDLTDLNDTHKYTFDQIADAIETTYLSSDNLTRTENTADAG